MFSIKSVSINCVCLGRGVGVGGYGTTPLRKELTNFTNPQNPNWEGGVKLAVFLYLDIQCLNVCVCGVKSEKNNV